MNFEYYSLPKNIELRRRKDYCFIINNYSQTIQILHPSEAVLLCFLDGTTNISDLIYLIKEIYRISQIEATSFVIETIKKTKNFLISSNKKTKSINNYNPLDYIKIQYSENLKNELLNPFYLDIILSKKCNFKCFYCYNETEKINNKLLSKKLLINIIDQAKKLEIQQIYLNGGEPFLHPDILDIIKYIKSRDIFVNISTNASLLNKQYITALSKEIDVIQVSLDSNKPNIHHNMTRSNNTFEKIIDNIKLLISKGIMVRTNAVITLENYPFVEEYIDYMINIGVFEIRITLQDYESCEKSTSTFHIFNSEQINILKELIICKKKEKNFERINLVIAKTKKWENKNDIIKCPNIKNTITIFPNGNVGVCDRIENDKNLIYGNINNESLSDLWYGKRHLNLIKNITDKSDCKKCRFLEDCSTGCFNLSKATYGDPFAKDPRCEIISEN